MKFPETVKGAIFDVDDTLLDNQAGVKFGTIHEVTRRRAIHQVAEKYSLQALASLTEQENYEAFAKAKYHSIDGAVWQIFFEKGIVDVDELDPNHKLLNEVVQLKNELHAHTLREYGRTVLYAAEFIAALGSVYAIADKMAIASSAIRRDINIFLDELTSLRVYFPDSRIISYESVPHGRGKPHPEPFDRAFLALNLPDSERRNVLAFDDDPRGIISAKKAGLFVCAITSRYTANHPDITAAEPDMIIDRYADVVDILQKKSQRKALNT